MGGVLHAAKQRSLQELPSEVHRESQDQQVKFEGNAVACWHFELDSLGQCVTRRLPRRDPSPHMYQIFQNAMANGTSASGCRVNKANHTLARSRKVLGVSVENRRIRIPKVAERELITFLSHFWAAWGTTDAVFQAVAGYANVSMRAIIV